MLLADGTPQTREDVRAEELYPDSRIDELKRCLPRFVSPEAEASFPLTIRRWAAFALCRGGMEKPRPRHKTSPCEARNALRELAKRLEAVERQLEAIETQLHALPADALHALIMAGLPPTDGDMSDTLGKVVEASHTFGDLRVAVTRSGFAVTRFAMMARRAEAAVDAQLREAERELAAATRRNVGAAMRRLGRRPKCELKEALDDLAAIFLDVTGKRPTISNNRGRRGGKFHAFATCALEPLWPDDVGMGIDGLLEEVCKVYGEVAKC